MFSVRKVKDVITFLSQYSRNFPFLGKNTHGQMKKIE